MGIDEIDFVRQFSDPKVRKHLSDSLLTHGFNPLLDRTDRFDFLVDLGRKINEGQYFPSVPRGYVTHKKSNGVPRFTPLMTIEDIVVYFYAVRKLERRIALNRVPGTFGGWSMGNTLRLMEDEELADFPNSTTDHDVPYPIQQSFNPVAWSMFWKHFQTVAFRASLENDYSFFVKFDIANYYDSINLDLLERRLRLVIGTGENDVCDLLFSFLRYWNRRVEGYSPKSVGLPQDEKADCSRILANFLLQVYDREISNICLSDGSRSKYLRYADDQIIMTDSRENAERLLLAAATALHRIGLNINASKVIWIEGREDFHFYWSFEMFDGLKEKGNKAAINQVAEQWIQENERSRTRDGAKPWRPESVLRRLINVGLNQLQTDTRSSIVRSILEKPFLLACDSRLLGLIHQSLSNDERNQLFDSLENLANNELHDWFHMHVRGFYLSFDPPMNIDGLDERIQCIRYA